MTGLTRSDFYRILLPGAIGVVLLVVVLRTVWLTPGTWVDESAADLLRGAIRFLEDPFKGVASAFTIGFSLYYLDPGYTTQAYRRGLPSEELRRLLVQEGFPDVDRRSLYFSLLNNDMPEPLRDRALVYGAFFRIGVLTILMGLGSAVVMPLGILAYGTGAEHFAGTTQLLAPTRAGILIVASALVVVAVWMTRRVSSRRDPDDASYPHGAEPVGFGRGLARSAFEFFLDSHLGVGAMVLLFGAGPWVLTASLLDWQISEGRALIVVGTGVSTGLWLAARLYGPLGVWAASLIGREPYYNRRPEFGIDATFFIDCCYGFVGLVGVAFTSSHTILLQQAVVVGLLLSVLLLAFVRKHERQLHGVNMNQNHWIRENLGLVASRLQGDGTPEQNLN